MSQTTVDFSALVAVRRRLHAIPEIAGREEQTASVITEELRGYKPDDLVTGVGGHGVIATFGKAESGHHLMFRAELDALPIPEQLELDYASKHDGWSHKCGHDGHMTILLGVARWLSENQPSTGKVSLLFQPAEETGEGAQAMLDDPQFTDFEPDRIFGLHNLPGYPKHQIVVRGGTFAAASVGMECRFTGSSSHAAHPSDGKSPAPAIAQLIQQLSGVPQLHTTIEERCKVTVIHAQLGEQAFGTSPADGVVMATLRAFDSDLLEKLKSHAERYARMLGETHQVETEITWHEPFSVTQSDAQSVDLIKKAAQALGLDLLEKEEPFAWSEDFGRFTDHYSGGFFGIGAGVDHPQLHAGRYDFPDEIIETGVTLCIELINQITE